MAGQAIAPAICFSDREMVMTLNMPAMKAYLARKDHRSLATLPGVALALNDQNRPVALGYCDTPRLFDFALSVVLALCHGGARRGAAGEDRSGSDLLAVGPGDPVSLAARHHHPQRTPHGLQLTCRYCLPTGGANGLFWLVGLQSLGNSANSGMPSQITSMFPRCLGDTVPLSATTVPTVDNAGPTTCSSPAACACSVNVTQLR